MTDDRFAWVDLRAALEHRPPASSEFDAFPPSNRRNILRWVATAKTEPTRTKRITSTAVEPSRDGGCAATADPAEANRGRSRAAARSNRTWTRPCASASKLPAHEMTAEKSSPPPCCHG